MFSALITLQLPIFKYQLNIYSMNHQYDFEEQLISERIPVIQVPNITPQIASSRGSMCLNGQTLKNIQKYLMESKLQQKIKIDQIKAKQQYIGHQISKQQLKKQQKLKHLEQIQKQKMFKECTFKPNTNIKSEKRGLNQFLQNQNAFTKKVMQKRQTLKKNLQQSKQKQTYRPKVNSNLNKKRNTQIPIHQRLYALKDKENIVDNREEQQNNSFKPSITQKSKKIMRNGPIQDLLYGDALRRQQKAKDMNNIQNVNFKSDKGPNLNNEKYAAQKFIRQYFNVLEELNVSSSIHNQIQYIMFNEILKTTGFIQVEESCDNSISTYQRSLVHDAYQIIQKFTVNARNICVFLLAIIGIYHINPVNFQEGQQSVPEKQFNLDQVDGRKLQKHFDTFFRNRLNSQQSRRNPQNIEKYSFQPKINKKSQQLAQKFRNHMLQEANQLLQNYPQLQFSIPQDGIISHTDLLVLNKMAKDLQNNKKKQQTLQKDMQQCTFKPTTLSSLQTLNNSKISQNEGNLGSKKSLELYNYYKSLQSKKQSLKISRQVDDSQCTFIPNTNKQKVQTNTPYAKQIDQTLYRLHKGRQQHELKKQFLQRGQKNKKMQQSRKTNSINNQKSRCSLEEYQDQQIPTLILDVNLGNKMDRITLYKKDENKLSQVARQFSKKHELDQQSQAKLLQSLEIELNNVLDKIQEDQQSQDIEEH